jgi:ornithine carbamoyltransferase
MAAAGLKGLDFLRVDDLNGAAIEAVLDLADHLKSLQARRLPHPWLAGRTLGMIFEKPSTRTRVSFEVGMVQLGGHAVHLSSSESQLGRGEPVQDTGAVLSRYLDAIVIRTHAHERVAELAAAASVPVINGLTDEHHPCQALADFLTIQQAHGGLRGVRLAFIGDGGDNVAHSLLEAGALAGAHVTLACPPEHAPNPEILSRARQLAELTDATLDVVTDQVLAARGADVVYADVWTSMGEESERDERARIFRPYEVTEELMALARPDAIFLHCLPAHRGEEVDAAVIDGPHSAVWTESANRLPTEAALLLALTHGFEV